MKNEAKLMKNEAKLMKKLETSDMNLMVLSITTDAAASLAMPVTALIWGVHAFTGADNAVWGTLPSGSFNTSGFSSGGFNTGSPKMADPQLQGPRTRQDLTAIWGTCGIWAPMQHAGNPWPAKEIGG
jgi:hypothetical protein